MPPYKESYLEEAILEMLVSLGWQTVSGSTIAPGESAAERQNYDEILLAGRLRAAITSLNPELPSEAQEEAARQVLNVPGLHPGRDVNNRAFHEILVEGVQVTYRDEEGRQRGARARLLDFEQPANNDFLAVNQFTIQEHDRPRRMDVLLFVNGLPLVLIELKSPSDAQATIKKAYAQLQTYKAEVPSLFVYNEICLVADGAEAKVGSYLAPFERFMPWRTVDGVHIEGEGIPGIETTLRGMLARSRLLDIIHHFITFADDDGHLIKMLAAYHQLHAVNAAVAATLEALKGDKRIGVVWHTQGSGKSLTMLFYAGKLIARPEMQNPTLVVITDRNDLDDQLFTTFAAGRDLLRQAPVQAQDRAQLKQLLKVASGGVVFTTAQKFFPEQKGQEYDLLSDRDNIVVIADEAHRSQYGFVDGYAAHLHHALPNASFIGFSGTPIELDDRNTRQVFGDYISIYDIEQAIHDDMTVPIYYEARLARISIADEELPRLDAEFEEITEAQEQAARQALATKWARLEAAVGTPKRLQLLAEDIVQHFEARLEALNGKGMVVAMSRRIAVDLYDAIVKLRPDWHGADDAQGVIKVVMTGSASDPVDWQGHIRSKSGRKTIEKRFKDPDDPLKLVIVRDMWLTGFDVPALHTMYLDKPMKGHTLMQAIARVNRVFGDKPGGLVVDYLGIAEPLKDALAVYASSGGKGETAIDQREAVRLMMARYETVKQLFNGFDYSRFSETDKRAEQLRLVTEGANFILSDVEMGMDRFLKNVADLSAAFALSVTQPETSAIREDLAFFQAVRATLIKSTARPGNGKAGDETLDLAVRQMVAEAVTPEGVMDIFEAAGLPKPEISVLSDSFLMGLQNLPQKHLAVEMLRKLLNDEIRTRSRRNLVQSRSFAAMLDETIRRYQARSIEAAQVIVEMIELAKEIKQADQRGQALNLTMDEFAFYTALAENESARDVLGDEQLSIIAREVLRIVHENTTIDWAQKESVRANLRRLVKRVLRHYGYPPDLQEAATLTVLEQAELLASE